MDARFVNIDSLLESLIYANEASSIDRKQIYDFVIKNAKEVLSDYKRKVLDLKDSIIIESEDKDDFLSKSQNTFCVYYYDAWKFSKNARDNDIMEPFWKAQNDILDSINKKVKKYGKVECTGDWDDGFFEFKLSTRYSLF